MLLTADFATMDKAVLAGIWYDVVWIGTMLVWDRPTACTAAVA